MGGGRNCQAECPCSCRSIASPAGAAPRERLAPIGARAGANLPATFFCSAGGGLWPEGLAALVGRRVHAAMAIQYQGLPRPYRLSGPDGTYEQRHTDERRPASASQSPSAVPSTSPMTSNDQRQAWSSALFPARSQSVRPRIYEQEREQPGCRSRARVGRVDWPSGWGPPDGICQNAANPP
jgi:hypothetical protein